MSDREKECTAVGEPLEALTLAAAFQRTVAKYPSKIALRTIGGEVELTWSHLDQEVRSVAAGLAALGVSKGDRVAMMLRNTIENHVVDCAVCVLGAAPFGIFNSSSIEQIAYQVAHAEAKVIVTERRFLDKVRQAAKSDGSLVEHIVVVDGGHDELTLHDVKMSGDPAFDVDAVWRSIDPEDVACVIFTSGTTGPPKAAQWSHRMIMSGLRATHQAIPIPEKAIISYLPLASAAGRINGLHYAVVNGATMTVCPENADLPKALIDAHPDMFTSTPRWFEKLQVAIEQLIAAEPVGTRERLNNALKSGIAFSKSGESGVTSAEIDGSQSNASSAADADLFKPILHRLGLDELKVVIIGGASVAPEMLHFFRAVGIPLLEAYGATEVSICVYNRVHDFKTGTAGKPLPGVELSLEDDGEILIRGDLNMSGYLKDPDRTREVLDDDGWIRTGDIGVLDTDGFLTIVDRKKDIIINSHGKNMSPAVIESAIVGESSLIAQLVVVGEARRYVTALVTVDRQSLAQFVSENPELSSLETEDILRSDLLRQEIQRAVDRGNARLNSNEQIKKFILLPEVWEFDSAEVTPTGKLRRRAITTKYADAIESLYE
ncbi:AMP-dependent synthetase/ligase [Rhodococcus sp. NPDC019627]|uniref:AMP-dependent synthetase/ligase n=1 Tax=unclassified Rhodococcus (in: high G+C Gram-positive bacteria) TaxID=192944 RepID=UPI0033EE76EA